MNLPMCMTGSCYLRQPTMMDHYGLLGVHQHAHTEQGRRLERTATHSFEKPQSLSQNQRDPPQEELRSWRTLKRALASDRSDTQSSLLLLMVLPVAMQGHAGGGTALRLSSAPYALLRAHEPRPVLLGTLCSASRASVVPSWRSCRAWLPGILSATESGLSSTSLARISREDFRARQAPPAPGS